ncbi:MAG: hypothetical protein IPH69_04480 [Bacteroidales bacterium]|nr:hypothetical protein [Bacteroidales bacterium]
MKPDRSNYEIWFIDWLDGNLDSNQIEELNIFLDKNPDLREEFRELSPVVIEHSDSQYKNKKSLMRSPADISESQFEYLSVAFLENDLTTEQKTELIEITELDADKKRSFELIQKTRISPVSLTYAHKSKLLRRTPSQIVIRLSIIGLSAAAVSTFIITTFLNSPREISDSINNTASIIIPEKIIQITVEREKEVRLIPVIKEQADIIKTELAVGIPNDSVENSIIVKDNGINKINFSSDLVLSESIASNTLMASGITFSVPEEDDGRSNVSRFISKTFREKILREKAAPDSPLKGYEIAEAGVTGLNKLLGWEMALDKNNDENGELSSVYFSSKLLKFNTPVKKSEPLP